MFHYWIDWRRSTVYKCFICGRNCEWQVRSWFLWQLIWTLKKLAIFRGRIRGRLCSIDALMGNVGILSGYWLGTSLDFRLIPCIFIVVPILFVIVFSSVPNTPGFYYSKGQFQVYYKILSCNVNEFVKVCIFQLAENANNFYERGERNETMEEMSILTKFEKLTTIAECRIQNRFQIEDLCMCHGFPNKKFPNF